MFLDHTEGIYFKKIHKYEVVRSQIFKGITVPIQKKPNLIGPLSCLGLIYIIQYIQEAKKMTV